MSVADEISDAFRAKGAAGGEAIAATKVRAWMRSDDLEALGALAGALWREASVARIQPALDYEEVFRFLLEYYERCLRENPEGEWAEGRYPAGSTIASWFTALWDNASVPRERLLQIKNWLAALYRQGDDDLRLCIETATLEYLFERAEIAAWFEDWLYDPLLGPAYERALDWGRHQGRPPGRPRPKKRSRRGKR
jgi:hypothetical protein